MKADQHDRHDERAKRTWDRAMRQIEYEMTTVPVAESLDQIVADIDARGWLYRIDNYHDDEGERRGSDVGITIYDRDGHQLCNGYGGDSLAEALRLGSQTAMASLAEATAPAAESPGCPEGAQGDDADARR